MKQQDIAVVIVIVFFAGIFSFFISNKFFSTNNNLQEGEVVQAISSEFTIPESKYFNSDSINPTVKIEISPNNNKEPFTNEDQ